MPSSVAVLFLIVCITFSCGTGEKENSEIQVTQLLANRRKGLQENNPSLYLSAVSRNYNDGIDTYDTLKKRCEEFLTQYSHLQIKIEKRTVYIDKDRATVVEEYRLTGFLPSGKKRAFHRQGVLRLEYNKTDGWKIVNGIDDFSIPPETR